MKHLIVIGNNGNQYVISKLEKFNPVDMMNDYYNHMTSVLEKDIPIEQALSECSKYLEKSGEKYGYRYREISK